MQDVMGKIRNGVESLIVFFVCAMVALTFLDVIGRRLFGRPIYGANDITEHLMGLMVFAGLPIITAAGAHLTVDILDRVLDRPEFRFWKSIIALVVAAVLGLVSWLFLEHGINAGKISEVSQALRIPRQLIYFYMSASCALSAFMALIPVFSGSFRDRSGEETP